MSIQIQVHFETAHERKEDRYKCPFCNFTAHYARAVYNHKEKCELSE